MLSGSRKSGRTPISSINALTLSPALAGMLLRPSPEKRGRFFTKFNEYFEVAFDDRDFDTIGGLTINAFGHLPTRGESIVVDGFRFLVVRADSRRVRLLNVERIPLRDTDSDVTEEVTADSHGR